MSKWLILLFITLIFTTFACNSPAGNRNSTPNMTLTAAVGTIQANMTQSSFIMPTIAAPTNTIFPTSLPPTVTQPPTIAPIPCNAAAYVEDVSYPDGTQVTVGQTFTKTWRFKNVGSCAWNSSYQLFFQHGDLMGGLANLPLTNSVINPGQTVDISVNLTAPNSAGTHRGYWMMRDPNSNLFGLKSGAFWVEIQSVPMTPTPTQTRAIIPKVIGVNLTVTGSCGKFHIKADISTNAAGSVAYHWVYSNGISDPSIHSPLVFGGTCSTRDPSDRKSRTRSSSLAPRGNRPFHSE